jgi:hypothetical protein
MSPQPLQRRTSMAALILLAGTAYLLEPSHGQAQLSREAIEWGGPKVARLAPRALEMGERGLAAVKRFSAGSGVSLLGTPRSAETAAGLWEPDRAMISRQPLVGLHDWQRPTLGTAPRELQSSP